jgi:hypothetical protein
VIDALTWNPNDPWQVADQQTGWPLWEEPMRLLRIKLHRKQKETDLRRAETFWELRTKLKLP